MKSAVMAGLAFGGAVILIALLGSVIPFVGCCNCLIPIGGGLLAVYFYSSKTTAPITPGEGATLGAIAGAVGGLLYLIIGVPLSYVISAATMAAQLAQLREAGITFFDGLGGFVLTFVLGIVGAVIFAALSTLGGLIGAAVFNKNRPGGTGTPPPPPPTDFGGSGGGYGGTTPPAGGGYGGTTPPAGGPGGSFGTGS